MFFVRLLLPLGVVATSIASADTITLRAPTRGGANYQVEGTIADYQGDVILIERTAGPPKSYPAERVLQIETTRPPGYDQAQRAMGKLAWAAAGQQLIEAGRQELRPWARRQILIDLMRCRIALRQWPAAGELLLAIHQSDPTTPAWHAAPLPWFASDGVPPAKAKAWLDSTDPAAQLLGASWSIGTPQQPNALQILSQLARSKNSTIAILAEAQLWRPLIVTIQPNQADAWQARIKTFPPTLRPGPQHVLAQAELRLARYDAAALTALEAPLTGVGYRELSARSLLLAARATEKAGHASEAERLLMEVQDKYRDTLQHIEAKTLLSK